MAATKDNMTPPTQRREPSAGPPRRTSVLDLRETHLSGKKLIFSTAYDATMARLMDAVPVDGLLVGDSLGMVVQGLETTLPVTLDDVIYHAKAVARGSSGAHLVGDLPFMSYQASLEDALRSAGRMLKEGSVQAVKLEGGEAVAESIHRTVQTGIPVMGHVGLTPQSVHAMGGFRVQGRDPNAADRIRNDARCVEEAGAYALVLEGIPASLAKTIQSERSIPTIGIGAGPHCDGQILVSTDLLGLSPDFKPKFVKHFGNLWDAGVEAGRAFRDAVSNGSFPDAAHSFGERRSSNALDTAESNTDSTRRLRDVTGSS